MLTVTMRDERLRPRGQIRCIKAEAIFRLNAPATFSVEISPEDVGKTSRIKKGWGLVLTEEKISLSGPITSRSYSTSRGLPERHFSGISDLAALSDRLTYPNPQKPPASQDIAYYKKSGAAETIIKNLVADNLGPAALTERRTYGLEIAKDQRRGKNISIRTRLKSVLDEAAQIASQNGLVIDCAQTPYAPSIIFDVRPVADKSRRIRLTTRADELLDYNVKETAPTSTVVVVGGQGEGADRVLQEHKMNKSNWGLRRIETFKDRRDTEETAELTRSATEILKNGEEKIKITFTIKDSQVRRFGRDYFIGDIITVELDNGIIFTEQLTAAKVLWADGYREVDLTIGNTDEDFVTSAERKKISSLAQQITSLETI